MMSLYLFHSVARQRLFFFLREISQDFPDNMSQNSTHELPSTLYHFGGGYSWPENTSANQYNPPVQPPWITLR